MATALSHTQRIKTRFPVFQHICISMEDLKKEAAGNVVDLINYIAKRGGLSLRPTNSDISSKLGEPLESCLPKTGKYSLEEVLNLSLHSQHLDYRFEDGCLAIVPAYNDLARRLETYDVSDLIAQAIERQFDIFAEDFVWNETSGIEKYDVFGINFEDILSNEQEIFYTESGIIQLIKENVPTSSYIAHAPHTMITPSRGKLAISEVPDIHLVIHNFLDHLRKLSQIPIVLESRFIVCKSNLFRQINLEFKPIYTEEKNMRTMTCYASVSPKQEAELFKTIEESKDAFTIKHNPINLRHLETKHIVRASRTHFLAGYDLVKKQEKIGRMYDGVIAKIRPQIELEKNEIRLDMEVDVAVVTKPVVSIPVFEGEVAIPSQMMQHTKTSLTVGNSEGILVAGFVNPYEDEGDRSFVGSRKKDQLMLYIKAHIEQK